MLSYLWVALGGALGSLARLGASALAAHSLGTHFPFGTLLVNVTGSFLFGFLASLTAPDGRWTASAPVRTFLLAGVCGGYTTFSAFSAQTFELLQEGRWLHAATNTALSVLLCLAAVWLGHLAARALRPA
ncbi:MAG: hypothetical protein RJA22_301 [Verrucomicrobiota bacterium]|jgi:CrcB protein